MKKTLRSFKFLIVSCIVFLCATIGFVFNVSLPNSFRVSAFTLGVKNSLSNSDVENFGNAVAAMNSQYPIEDNDLVFFHKEKNLTQNQDGDFIVDKQTFASLTNTSFEIISENATTNQMRSCAVDTYYLEELAAQNSYEVTHGENNIVLTRKYATRRLVLETTNPNFDRCGAVAVANIDNLYILQYTSIEETRLAYEYYQNQSDIDYVEVDIICWIEDEECEESEVMPAGLGDNYSYKTWGAEAMGVPEYSEYLTSLVNAENTNVEKLPDIVVAVLDTGIDTDHPWFTDRLLYDEYGKIIGKDYTNVHPDEEYGFEDEHSHGTHCAGIICDMTLSNVKILPLKFMAKNSDGTSPGSGSNAIAAMHYTMQLKEQGYNVVAINMSFSSKRSDDFYKDIIKDLYDADIMPVAAAGNDGHDASNNSPANVKTSITVSAICRDLTLASFSNFGSLIDVCAPGVSINSANNDGGIVGKQGTSMAAPHVAAYIALLKSDPMHEYSKSDIMNILYGKYNDIQTVLDLGDAGKDDSFGYGLPILNHLIPDYLAVDIESNGHGTVSATGLNFYQKNNSIKISLTPDKNCHVSGIYLDGSLLPYTRFIEEYDLTNLSGTHHLRVEFATKYTVNHFLEPIYELNNVSEIPDISEYKLIKSEIYYSQFDIETKATSHEYTGFTPIEFEQQIVKDDTVINIYYKRNKYFLTVNIPQTGFENITGSGEYLYGQEIDLNPVLQKNFEIESWDIEYCEDVDFLNSLDLHQNQTFSMPASDFTITAKLKHHYVDWIGMATWGGVIFIGVVIIMFITRPRIK